MFQSYNLSINYSFNTLFIIISLAGIITHTEPFRQKKRSQILFVSCSFQSIQTQWIQSGTYTIGNPILSFKINKQGIPLIYEGKKV